MAPPSFARIPAIPALVFCLALICRIAGQWALGAYTAPETWEYEEIATNILAGQGYTYPHLGKTYVAAVSSPLYIFLTVAVYAVTSHSQGAMLLLQAVLGAATAVLAAWMAGRLFRPPAAVGAGLLVAIHPAFVVYASKLHALTLDMLAFVVLVGASLALPYAPRLKHLVGLGLLFGLAGLSRGTALFLLPVALWWLSRFRRMRLVSASTLAVVGAAALVFLPWSVRSSVLLGQPVLLSSESTEWLWRGNNPAATGSSFTEDGRLMLDVAPPELRARIVAADEAGRIRLYRDAAFDFAREQPLRTAQLFLLKLRAFWWMSPSTGQLYPGAWTTLYTLWYAGTVVLAVVGSWAGLRDARARAGVLLILLTLIVVSVGQAVFYVEGRHRWGVEPLLLILTGGGVAALAPWLPFLPRLRSRASRSSEAVGAPGAIHPGAL